MSALAPRFQTMTLTATCPFWEPVATAGVFGAGWGHAFVPPEVNASAAAGRENLVFCSVICRAWVVMNFFLDWLAAHYAADLPILAAVFVRRKVNAPLLTNWTQHDV